MSRRESRDSDSKQHRSRFDREPSPKRSRRDSKPAPERLRSSDNLDSRNQTDQDQKRHRRLQDGLPLETPLKTDPKPERGDPSNDNDRKPDGQHEGTKLSSGPTEVPRSRSYFQHDERGNAARVGRSSGRGATGERGWWRDSRDQHNEKTENKKATNETWKRDDRAKGDEKGNWRHDRFFEIETDAPPARKRPAFREKKILVDSELADRAATVTSKSSNLERPAEESLKEERGRSARHLDRSEKPFAGDRAPNRREPPRGGFPSRERYRGGGAGGDGNGNYRRRDGFSGGHGFHASGTRVEKWKHDLYQEANRSPTPKNEEDQIAKVEALLAS
ncbi:Btz domain containing protein [Trema orientale]|uniref:Btz domain containing protein n=1 Tax=Trema orientale TaxID=63057 RepID=A0A2P5EYC2_TREOI|nr:Btz domain containing protein [Trema orientale]